MLVRCLNGRDTVRIKLKYEILEFLDLRAQASETSLSSTKKTPRKSDTPVTTFTANSQPVNSCILCSSERHPIYFCPKVIWYLLCVNTISVIIVLMVDI